VSLRFLFHGKDAMKRLAMAVVTTVALLAGGTWAESATEQPVQFPHKTHLDLKLQCTNCHQRAERDAVAGRPPTALCVACHLAGKKTEETKNLLAFGEKGVEIPWKRVWRLPSNVFFPHSTHVAVAKIRCQTCHGPMETLTAPPTRPLRTLTMNDCLGCHEAWQWPKDAVAGPQKVAAGRRLSTDCNACHR
jgi:hypothetical protein